MVNAWNGFKGAAKRLDDVDIPRIAHKIGVGEDELHAFMDVETLGSGFDKSGRPKMLFEPHVFYRNLKGAQRTAAVKAGLAYAEWGAAPYPRDSYPRLIKAIAINESAALMASSWGASQVLGENYKMVGFPTVGAMVRAFMEDEETHLDAMVAFIKAAKIDDEMRALAALTRPTTAADCEKIVSVYNGPGYKKYRYHIKMAAAHNKWRKIRDTPWSPGGKDNSPITLPIDVPAPTPKPAVATQAQVIEQVQILLRDKGYPEVGTADGKFGNRTRNAILAFQADNDLSLTGQVTDALLAELIKAPKREMAAARETATEKDLKGEAVVDSAGWLKKIGTGILVSSGVGGVLDGTGSLDDALGGIGKLRSIAETIISISPWLIVAAAGVGVYIFGRRIVKKHVEAYREGRAL